MSGRREDGEGSLKVLHTNNLKPSSDVAECGSFPLLYRYGDRDELFDMKKYLAARGTSVFPSEDEQD